MQSPQKPVRVYWIEVIKLRKISLVADASALVSLASLSLLPLVLTEFNVVVSDVVAQELREMSTYADL